MNRNSFTKGHFMEHYWRHKKIVTDLFILDSTFRIKWNKTSDGANRKMAFYRETKVLHAIRDITKNDF